MMRYGIVQMFNFIISYESGKCQIKKNINFTTLSLYTHHYDTHAQRFQPIEKPF